MRIQLDINDREYARWQEVKSLTGLSSHKDLINNAVTLFDWAVRSRQSGAMVGAMTESGFRELLMPALEAATRHPAKVA